MAYFLTSLRRGISAADFAALDALTANEWEELAQLAIQQRVAPLLYWQWQAHRLPPALPATAVERLERHYFQNALRNQCLRRELRVLLQAMREANIPVIVLKGAHLAASVYDDPAQRFMTDIDLLVRREHSEAAYHCLRQLGYDAAAPFLPEPYLACKHHFPALRRTGAVAEVELHWNLTPPHRAWSIDAEDLWKRAIPWSIAGTAALCLNPEDLLLHLCYHATHHHLSELFWHGIGTVCDVDRVIRCHAASLDWDAIGARAQAWGWQKGVYLQMTLAAELLGTPVPPRWLAALYPAGCEAEVWRAAQSHLFVRKGQAHRVTSGVTRLRQETRLQDKGRYLWQILCPTPAEMDIRYRNDSTPPGVWWSYPVHWLYLARRWSYKGWRLWRGDPLTPRLSEDQYRVMKWLELR